MSGCEAAASSRKYSHATPRQSLLPPLFLVRPSTLMQARPSSLSEPPVFRPDMTSRERDFIERGRVGQIVQPEPDVINSGSDLEAVAWFWVMTMLVGLVVAALFAMFRRSG